MSPNIAFINPFASHRARVAPLDVLVIDADDANRERLCTLLRMAGHRVTTAELADDALDVLRGGLTHVIMTGRDVGGMALPGFAAHLRALPLDAPSRPHIVALVPVTEAVSGHALDAAGVTAFLATPVAASRLLELMATLAGRVAPNRSQPALRAASPARTANLDPTMLNELAALGLGAAFEREFVAQCLGDLRTAIEGVVAAARDLNWQYMRDYALGAKGVASSVGLVRVATLADSVVKSQDWVLARDGRAIGERLCDALHEAQELLRERGIATSRQQTRNAAG